MRCQIAGSSLLASVDDYVRVEPGNQQSPGHRAVPVIDSLGNAKLPDKLIPTDVLIHSL